MVVGNASQPKQEVTHQLCCHSTSFFATSLRERTKKLKITGWPPPSHTRSNRPYNERKEYQSRERSAIRDSVALPGVRRRPGATLFPSSFRDDSFIHQAAKNNLFATCRPLLNREKERERKR